MSIAGATIKGEKLWIFAAAALVLSGADCARPQTAADIQGGAGCRDGYRRQGTIRDYALGRAWLVYASCAHPEMPRIAMDLDGRNAAPVQVVRDALAVRAPLAVATRQRAGENLFLEAEVGLRASPEAAPAVASGSRVRLWRRDRIANVELFGVALESGSPGAAIRVRLTPGGQVLRGTVREAGSVELDVGSEEGFRRPGQ